MFGLNILKSCHNETDALAFHSHKDKRLVSDKSITHLISCFLWNISFYISDTMKSKALLTML